MKVAYGIELQVLATTVASSLDFGISTGLDRGVKLSTATSTVQKLHATEWRITETKHYNYDYNYDH